MLYEEFNGLIVALKRIFNKVVESAFLQSVHRGQSVVRRQTSVLFFLTGSNEQAIKSLPNFARC